MITSPLKAQTTLPLGDGLAALFMLVLVVITRGIWLGDPVADFDEQLYSFIGQRMSLGELPFVDWWDRKPFGLFAIFWAAHSIFGQQAWAYQVLAAFFALAAAWLTYDLAKLLVGRFSASITAGITILLLSAYANYSGQSEVFFAPLMLAMVRLVALPRHPNFARRAALAMLIGGLALQIKYTVLPQCLFLGGYALWAQLRHGASIPKLIKQAILYAVLGLLPTAIIALYYAFIGEFEAFAFANFLSFFDRQAAPQGRWAGEHALGIAPLVILAIGGIYAALRMRAPQDWSLWLLFGGWALFALAGVLLPGTVYLYYYAAMAAPAALLALPLLDRRAPARIVPAIVLIFAFGAMLFLPERYQQSQDERAVAREMAQIISPHVDREENCLWLFDGPTALYQMSNSCVLTRFVYPDHLNNALEDGALGIDQAEEVARILSAKPAVIVTASRAMTLQNMEATALVEAALAASYNQHASAELHDRTLYIWLRSPKSN